MFSTFSQFLHKNQIKLDHLVCVLVVYFTFGLFAMSDPLDLFISECVLLTFSQIYKQFNGGGSLNCERNWFKIVF